MPWGGGTCMNIIDSIVSSFLFVKQPFWRKKIILQTHIEQWRGDPFWCGFSRLVWPHCLLQYDGIRLSSLHSSCDTPGCWRSSAHHTDEELVSKWVKISSPECISFTSLPFQRMHFKVPRFQNMNQLWIGCQFMHVQTSLKSLMVLYIVMRQFDLSWAWIECVVVSCLKFVSCKVIFT